MHDCLPRKLWYQTPTRMSDTWNGDVWKAIVECRTLENIDTYIRIKNKRLIDNNKYSAKLFVNNTNNHYT